MRQLTPQKLTQCSCSRASPFAALPWSHFHKLSSSLNYRHVKLTQNHRLSGFWTLQQHGLSGSGLSSNTHRPGHSRITDHPVLESPATRIIGFYPPILSRAPRPTSSRAHATIVFLKDASWTLAPLSSGVEAFHISCPIPAQPQIIQFWLLQKHVSSGSGLSSNTDHPVLPQPPS